MNYDELIKLDKDTFESELKKMLDEQAEKTKKDAQSDTDRRVTDAVKKTTDKLKAEADERERLAKMTEEEKAKELIKIKDEEISKYKREAQERTLSNTLRDLLKQNQLDDDVKDVFNLGKYMVEGGEDLLKSDVTKMKETMDSVLKKQLAEALKGKTPSSVTDDRTQVTDYDRAAKTGNTQAMILAGLNQIK